MFNKRHYEAIALTMQRIHPGHDTDAIDYDARLEMWHDIKRELASTFAMDNALFNEPRFVVACLPGRNVKARTAHLKVTSCA